MLRRSQNLWMLIGVLLGRAQEVLNQHTLRDLLLMLKVFMPIHMQLLLEYQLTLQLSD